jgi:hypothetical protein
MEYSIKVKTDDRLTIFIYALLCKNTYVNQVEEAVRDMEKMVTDANGRELSLCLGPLGIVAQEAARVIKGYGAIDKDKTVVPIGGLVCSKCGVIFHVVNQSSAICPKCGEVWPKA